MSLVYNNDKPIGKCESYSIDKVPGTSPFVMLNNFELKQDELNRRQKIILKYLKEQVPESESLNGILLDGLFLCPDEIGDMIDISTDNELFEVLAAFAEWGMKEVAE